MSRVCTVVGRAAAALLLGLGLLLPAAAQAELPKEYQIKAAFLYNFTKFAEWPAASFAGAASPIVIGVYCAEEFAAELRQIVAGRKVNGRALEVRRLETAETALAAQVVFVCAEQDTRAGAIERQVGASPVLTVGESDAFRQAGDIIHFVPAGDKLRFEIDLGAADRAGVKLSAQLLKLAASVRGGH